MKFTAIIPARYASTRFPGKPLAVLAGKPVIQHVWERAAGVLPQVIVATDDDRIAKAVRDFGGQAAMTAANHRCGTERCAEVAADCDADVVINIQGDEPFVSAEQLRALMACFDDTDTDIATLRRPLDDGDEAIDNPNCVKVVCDRRGFALYFSRSPIPYIRDSKNSTQRYAHVGLYAYRTRVLRDIVKLQPTPLELAESLEQLRWLENGYKIKVADCTVPGIGIDTPEDLAAAERLMAEQSLDRSALPAIHDIEARKFPDRKLMTPLNGVEIHLVNKPDHELIKITVMLPGGKAELGSVLALATARLIKEGCDAIPGCEAITGEQAAETFDYNGAEINASATDHHCIVTLQVLRRSLQEVIGTFSRLIYSANFPEKAVNAYKRNQIAHLQCEMQTPSYHSARAARLQYWGADHPLANDATIEQLMALDSDKLKACLRSMLIPSHIKVVAAGDIDMDVMAMLGCAFSYYEPKRNPATLAEIARLNASVGVSPDAPRRDTVATEDVPPAPKRPYTFVPMPPAAPAAAEPTLVNVPGSLQYSLTAWLPAVGVDHPDYWPLRMAVHMLGGYFGSRLMLNIREDKGYTYGIGAGAAVRPEGSVILISTEFDASYKDGVLDELRHELRRMATEPADREEFDRLRLNMAGTLASAIETPEGILSQIVQHIAADVSDKQYEDHWQALQQVTPQQVAEVSARYLDPANLHIVLAGDTSASEV